MNPIIQKIETRNNKEFYSLECSTPLINTKKLEIYWYKNGELIAENDTLYFEQIIRQPTSDRQMFISELKFKQDAQNTHGIYTCSLNYVDMFLHLVKNESYFFITKSNVFKNFFNLFSFNSFNLNPIFLEPLTYIKYNDTIEFVSEGEAWSDSCECEGWPLPKIGWYFNNKPLFNTSENVQLPYFKNHHSNITHLNSHLIIRKVNRALTGLYTCVLNEKLAIKNVTLKLTSSSGEDSNRSGKCKFF